MWRGNESCSWGVQYLQAQAVQAVAQVLVCRRGRVQALLEGEARKPTKGWELLWLLLATTACHDYTLHHGLTETVTPVSVVPANKTHQATVLEASPLSHLTRGSQSCSALTPAAY